MTISKSTDEGRSWAVPSVILRGSFQTAPTPVVSLGGTLYRSVNTTACQRLSRWAALPTPICAVFQMEDSSVGGVGALMLWASCSSDFLAADWWSRSTHCSGTTCLQEGSAVISPSGQEVWIVLRVNTQTAGWRLMKSGEHYRL